MSACKSLQPVMMVPAPMQIPNGTASFPGPDDTNSGNPCRCIKTRRCKYFIDGRCSHGNACSFAHSMHELSSSPDLTKTKLCFLYFRGQCPADDSKYAHGHQELRCTGEAYKTSMCKGWVFSGECKFGDTCRFAHGNADLRERVTSDIHPRPRRFPEQVPTTVPIPYALFMPVMRTAPLPTMHINPIVSQLPLQVLDDEGACQFGVPAELHVDKAATGDDFKAFENFMPTAKQP